MTSLAPSPVLSPATLGIDVVDLSNPRTRDRHLDRRFLDRVFTPAERALIAAAAAPELELWRLWAMKEAAFKAIGSHLHPAPPPVFAHREFVVSPSGGSITRGEVRWEEFEVPVRVEREGAPSEGGGAGWCAATARLGTPPAEGHRIASLPRMEEELGLAPDGEPLTHLSPAERVSVHSRASALVRLSARRALSEATGIPETRLQVVAGEAPRGRTPPAVLLDGSAESALRAGLRVTLSHDGPWIAWGWTADPEWVPPGGTIVGRGEGS